MLEDRLMRTVTPIAESVEFTYSFIVDTKNTSTTENRFAIRFSNKKGSKFLNDFKGTTDQGSSDNSNWKIVTNPIQGHQWNYTWHSMASGMYVLEIFTTSGQSVHRQPVELATSSGTGHFQTNGPLPTGVYTVVLSNRKGKRYLHSIGVN
jgi:hypothetical protein